LPDNLFDALGRQTIPAIGQDAGAKLNDHQLGGFDEFGTHSCYVTKMLYHRRALTRR
jgi:hypothetical protein